MPAWWRPLPRTDRYLARGFLVFFGLCLAGSAVLAFVADLTPWFKRIAGQVGERGVASTAWLVACYYAAWLPQLLLQRLLPVVLAFAGVLALTHAAVLNEFIALRAAGVSLRRLVAPSLATALAITLLYAATRDLFVPRLLVATHRLAGLVDKDRAMTVTLALRDGETMQIVSVGHFAANGRAHNFLMSEQPVAAFRAGANDATFYSASEAMLEPQGAASGKRMAWAPMRADARRTELSAHRRVAAPWTPTDRRPTELTPAMFTRHALGDGVLEAADLRRLAPSDPFARMTLHARRAAPWDAFAMTLLGASAALLAMRRSGKPSYVTNLLAGLAVAAGYMAVQSWACGMGQKELLPAPAAAWLSPALGVGVGLWMLSRAE